MTRIVHARVLFASFVVVLPLLAIAWPATAQSTSTFSGRVVDQGDAVLPGVTITAASAIRASSSWAHGSSFDFCDLYS